MNEAVARLESLYRDVGPGLLRYLRRRFGDAGQAEDLLQETFSQAARCLQRLSQAGSPRAWLFTIARNVGVTALRRHRKLNPLPAELPARERPEDPRLDSVRQAVSGLPDTLREAIELRLREELSYEEIAAVLEIPVGTVRSRLHHAVRRLRAAVTDTET